MTYEEFLKEVGTPAMHSVYLFEGPEEFIKHSILLQLKKKLLPEDMADMNYTELKNPDVAELAAAAETLPFLSEKRIVVVTDCAALIPPKSKDADTPKEEEPPEEEKSDAASLCEYLSHVSPSTVIIFYARGKAWGVGKLYKRINGLKGVVTFSTMSENDCAAWIGKKISGNGKSILPDAISQLVFTVGRDAAALDSEMQKLLAYTEERKEITADDIAAICTPSTECTVFQMIDAQTSGNTATAFTLLSTLLRNGESDFGILALLTRQYRILYHTARMAEEKTSSARQAEALGANPYYFGKTQQQARRFPVEKLRAAYDYLSNYEYDLKQGKLPQNGAVQTAMLFLESILRG